MNTKRSNYWYQQLGDSCYCSLSSHSISKKWSGLLFSLLFLIPHQSSKFCSRRLIIPCLPWQRLELVQLEEHNELDASNCACMGVSWESSAPDSSRAETHQIGLARPSSTFLIGLGYKAEMCLLCHWSTNLTCCRNIFSFFFSSSTLTLMIGSAFLHPQIIFHVRNIHWLMPTTLRTFFVIMALSLGRGPWNP